MMPISLKQSQPFNWSNALRHIFHSQYGGDAAVIKYGRDIQQIDDARQKATLSFRADQAAMVSIKDYVVLLNTVEARIPELREKCLDFCWSDSLRGPKVITIGHADLAYDRGCMLFNLAVLEYNIARTQAASLSIESLQAGRTGFLRAASIFEHLITHRPKTPEPVSDLSSDGLLLMKTVALAQAHEAFLAVVIAQPNTKAKNIAKVASQVFNLFNECLSTVQRPTLAKVVEPTLITMIEFHKLRSESVCAFHHSEIAMEKASNTGDGYGERVAWLEKAEMLARLTWEFARKKSIPDDMFKVLQKRYEVIQANLLQATHDNKNIYMQGIPELHSLVFIEGHSLQGQQIDSRLMEALPNCTIFQNLLVPWMRTAEETFQTKLSLLVKSYKLKVDSKVNEVRTALFQAGLPGSIESTGVKTADETLPDGLWRRLTEQVHNRGGVAHLIADAQDNRELNAALSNTLKELNSALTSERDSDELFRAQYGAQYKLQASRNLNSLMVQDVAQYRSLLVQAKQKDDYVAQAFAEHKGYLDLLTKTREQLSKFIPSAEEALRRQDPRAEKARQDVLVAYQDLQTSVSDCEGLKAHFESAAESSTIVPELQGAKNDISRASDYVAKGLAKFHQNYSQPIDAKLGTIQAKFSTLLEKNHSYAALRVQNDLTRRRDQALISLDVALSKYVELCDIIREGHRFYLDLKIHVTQLEKLVNDFCYVRNVQRDNGTSIEPSVDTR